MLEENAAVLGLQPGVGRLANALVAVLGPELKLGSPAYCSCRALIREMQVRHSCHAAGVQGVKSCASRESYLMLVLARPGSADLENPAASHEHSGGGVLYPSHWSWWRVGMLALHH